MTAGRPTGYRKKYCELAIELGSQGKSKAQIGAAIGVSRMTLDNWAGEFDEFFDAMATARDLALAWWEDTAQSRMIEVKDGERLNSSIWSRSMAARFPDDYRENNKLELSGGIAIDNVPDDELDQRIAALLDQQKKAAENG